MYNSSITQHNHVLSIKHILINKNEYHPQCLTEVKIKDINAKPKSKALKN